MDEEIVYDFTDIKPVGNNGLVAVGGNLSSGTLINAYKKGIFPWYNPGEIIQWYYPDPRFVLFPDGLIISHSMKNVLNKQLFRFSIDQCFADVIHHCRLAKRRQDQGTWISDEIEEAYNILYEKGIAHSAEAWHNDELVGGLYGVLLGKVFFGESMFANKSNASKFAFIKWIEVLKKNEIKLVDCQIYTPHLESFGAEFISGEKFSGLLKKWI